MLADVWDLGFPEFGAFFSESQLTRTVSVRVYSADRTTHVAGVYRTYFGVSHV